MTSARPAIKLLARAGVDADRDELQALGYAKTFERSMNTWQNFALGFTYLSPVCSVLAPVHSCPY